MLVFYMIFQKINFPGDLSDLHSLRLETMDQRYSNTLGLSSNFQIYVSNDKLNFVVSANRNL